MPPRTEPGGENLRRIHARGVQFIEVELDHSFEQAIAYFLFAALQQFYFDGNKRTARYMMNGHLMSHGFDAISVLRVEMLAPEHAGGLAAAAGQYGEQWARGVVDGWFGPGHHLEPDRYQWVESMPGLCAGLRAAGAPQVARLLAAGAWAWMGDQLRFWTATARAGMREPQLEALSSPLMGLLEAADGELRDEIMAALRGYGDNVLGCLIPALRSAVVLPVATRRAAGLDVVARDCTQRLGAIIARPLRDEDDWSIGWTGCGCDLCGTLGTFLGSRSRRTFEWPLATDGRRHVHTRIDSAGLPVRHQTRRKGRPYTLVLTKTEELFAREKDARQQAVSDLSWLTSAWGDG